MSILGGHALAIFAIHSIMLTLWLGIKHTYEHAHRFIDLIILIAWLGIPLAILLRTFHTGSVVGPQRLDPRRPAFPLLIAMMLAFCTSVLISSGYNLFLSHRAEASTSTTPATMPASMPTTTPATIPTTIPTSMPATLPATMPTTMPATTQTAGPAQDAVDAAFLYSAPSLVGLAMLLLADWMIGGASLLRRLGLERRRIGAGILVGVVAAIAVVPLVNIIMEFAQFVYDRMHFAHPMEHDLLKLVGDSPDHPIARVILIGSATFIAPVAEEIFFRGHLQTLLQRMLITISQPHLNQRAAVFGFPVNQGATPVEPPVPPVSAPAIPLASAFRPVWQTWVAIIITSAIFAAAHPGWMWPGIFFLAIGLGYVYERTGNLWANITLHLLFNTVSTGVYLYMLMSNT